MKTLLIGAMLAASVASVTPAAAQRIDIGPGGPSVDLRSRGERERDFRRREYRRDRDGDRRSLYRTERYDDRRGMRRRGNDY